MTRDATLQKLNRMKKWPLILISTILFINNSAAREEDKSLQKCSNLARLVEIEEGLPPFLLTAIIFIESSNMPWVVGVEGESYRYHTKEGALAKIQALKNQGKKNFDIGCMQINHYFHGNNFKTDHNILDPLENIKYAARLLKKLKKETGSWEKAVAYYNSKDLKFSKPYTQKVYQHWEKIRYLKAIPLDISTFANIPKSEAEATLSTSSYIKLQAHTRKITYITQRRTLIRK